MLKLLIIVGARPQFIKLAPLQLALNNSPIKQILVHTGQHYDPKMSAVFFDTLKLSPPSYKLPHGGKTQLCMLADMLKSLESILLSEQPDFVLVFGDTTSSLAGALASAKLQIPLIHVEAGLRSFQLSMPEEQNRVLADRLSSLLFAPSQIAVNNLHNEGIMAPQYKIYQVGDIMKDASLLFAKYAKAPDLTLPKSFGLCTIHRQENLTKEALSEIFAALCEIAKSLPLLLPLHPSTARFIHPKDYPGILFCEPLSYLEMLYVLGHSKLVITDSGGLQKESYFFQKPCIVLRENSEWMELVDSHYNVLAGNNAHKILQSFVHIASQASGDFGENFYGNGDCAMQILSVLKEYL
ncbi:non-hydrolyzing UDP-N-acetylglucosamine 2-epimerase [Helicobacter mustelae]|uniref:UDP-N-acetylglucosamine 2-epimerase n=1 Tax=Helicobacter mustelae (strain ATCC 43772 / CCUG 25715 / CIP 103759 / LMG 18044 / NCTC 12198 / R85-136P) TaxID=679897 RepID=D3UHF0_HELM1|nr:UDP-N-acetylglucosamine 2-epimerase (non-hydrolyzing) [Helicobacter mustelae]CBG39922.1 UDP-N-acetylglucosamine 2-epimerase [Helicobacter mustelae 12198]SQH71433.1 UDP-N-acetylglucosamine 2-epimerase [Helicobacter mustelae]